MLLPDKQTTKKEIKRLAIGGAIGAGLAIIYLHAPHAHADPINSPEHQHDMSVMCTYMTAKPNSYAGIADAIAAWQKQYGIGDQAAALGTQTLIDAVNYSCPAMLPTFNQWVASLPPAKPTPPTNNAGIVT